MRDRFIKFRVDNEEYDRIQELAEANGYESVSEFITDKIFSSRKPTSSKSAPLNGEVVEGDRRDHGLLIRSGNKTQIIYPEDEGYEDYARM